MYWHRYNRFEANKWTTTSFDFHQMAVHKRTTMLAHCNLKQNTWLCSKQSSFFSFYALPSVGKSKDAVVHWLKVHLHRIIKLRQVAEKWWIYVKMSHLFVRTAFVFFIGAFLLLFLRWSLFGRKLKSILKRPQWSVSSVTILLDYLFNISASKTLKNCLRVYNVCQRKLKMFPNTKWSLSKWPSF